METENEAETFGQTDAFTGFDEITGGTQQEFEVSATVTVALQVEELPAPSFTVKVTV